MPSGVVGDEGQRDIVDSEANVGTDALRKGDV